MRCILIDAHLSDGDQLVMHDVFPLKGIDLFKVSTRECVSTHPQKMYVLHLYRYPPLRWGSTGDASCIPIKANMGHAVTHAFIQKHRNVSRIGGAQRVCLI